jgi:hypothetical protein
MMNDKHASAVRALLARLEPGQSRPFYFVREGERQILHIEKLDTSPQRFADLSKVNAHLEAVDAPLSRDAKLLVGVVTVTPSGLQFAPSIRKGATNADLVKGLTRLKSHLRLTAWEVVDGSAADEAAPSATTGGAAAAPAATTPEAEDPRIALERKLAKLYKVMRAVDVERANAATLAELMERIEVYSSRGGKGDLLGLINRIGARQVVLAQLETIAASVETVRESSGVLRARLAEIPGAPEQITALKDLISDLETARKALLAQRDALVALSA